jgi:hypothetical protein
MRICSLPAFFEYEVLHGGEILPSDSRAAWHRCLDIKMGYAGSVDRFTTRGEPVWAVSVVEHGERSEV